MKYTFLTRILLAVTLLALFTSANAGTYGAQGKGYTSCGGLQANGKLQKPCGYIPATFKSESLDKCPKGSFLDLGTSSCWSCPAGYKRGVTTFGITTARACQKPHPGKKGEYHKATYEGTACPSGSFFDPARGGECWSCPSGYERTALPVRMAGACSLPARKNFASVQRHDPATGVFHKKCPKGQFAHNKYCYACPSGFQRTLKGISSPEACVQEIKAKSSKATVRGKAQCKPGEFVDFLSDPKSGGKCYSCPEAAARTVFAVTSDKACVIGANMDFARATETGAPFCETGQIFDLEKTGNPRVRERIRSQFGYMPSGLTGKHAGTCWACQPGYRRTLFAVWGKTACESNGIDWHMPVYRQPGLFGLQGSQGVVAELIAERTTIEEIAADMAPQLSKALHKPVTKDDAIRMAWKQIEAAPEKSGTLALAVYFKMLDAASNPTSASKDERALVNSFASAVTQYRTFLAKQSLSAYEAWNDADKKKNEVYNAVLIAGVAVGSASTLGSVAPLSGMALDDLKNTMWPVPDFQMLTLQSILDNTVNQATGEVQGQVQEFLYEKTFLSDKMLAQRFPNLKNAPQELANAIKDARKAEKEASELKVAKAGIKYLRKLVQKGTTKAAEEAAFDAMLTAAGDAGPQIVVTAAVEITTAFIQNQFKRANAKPRLEALVAEAKRPFEIKREMDTVDGRADIEGEWATVIAGDTKPSNGAVIKKAVDKILAGLAPAETTDAAAKSAGGQSKTTTQTSHAAAKPAGSQSKTATQTSTAPVVGTPVHAPSTATPVAPTAGKAVVAFDIVASTGTCLQAVSNRVQLMPCKGLVSTHWVSQGGQLKLSANMRQCLTSRTGSPYLTACRNGFPAQQWMLTDAGAIQSGVHACLEARGGTVAAAHCLSINPAQKWKAQVVK